MTLDGQEQLRAGGQSAADQAKPFVPRRRTTAEKLGAALLQLVDNQGRIVSHETNDWRSITFTGTRHEVVFCFNGPDEADVGERLIAELSEHEFHIPGQLVADATVREVDHRFGANEVMTVTCVLLLLEEV